MAFDEMAFAQAGKKYVDNLTRAIKEFYDFQKGHPNFGGNLEVEHKANGAPNDFNWKVIIKKPKKK